MLTRWTIENFKPLHGSVELSLGQVTILAGLNSSGKSSILQSILLLSQTFSNQNLDRPLILNGNIVQLGTFDSVHNDRAADNHMTIGFEMSTVDIRNPSSDSKKYRATPTRFPNIDDVVRTVSVVAKFMPAAERPGEAPGIEAVKVVLIETTINVTLSVPTYSQNATSPASEDNRIPVKISCSVSKLTKEKQAEMLQSVKEEYLRLIPYPLGENFIVNFSSEPEIARTAPFFLTRLAHFVPDRFISKFNLAERELRELAAIVEGLFESSVLPRLMADPSRRIKLEKISTRKLTTELIRKLKEISRDHGVSPQFSGETVFSLSQWFSTLRPGKKFDPKKRAALATKIKNELMSELKTEAADSGFGLENASSDYMLASLDVTVQKMINFFGGMIRYLGPLRADPQAAQGFAPSNEPDDVGFKGEYAAAVYDANRKQTIRWWNPVNGLCGEDSLEDAIDIWVRYLGVAHHLSTREAGLSGVAWMVQSVPTAKGRPLQSVGVGVSQVLPILVAGLLCPVGALLLIEQPELHLHARAQARLGDFFLGLSQVGKQCIIETHSDCLVNQFRYRMVKDEILINNNVAIYFAEQNQFGDTSFERIKISENGNVVNWPDGFFDENLHQEDRITKASIEARAKRNSKEIPKA